MRSQMTAKHGFWS